jgi:hypothetical protein
VKEKEAIGSVTMWEVARAGSLRAVVSDPFDVARSRWFVAIGEGFRRSIPLVKGRERVHEALM